MTERELLIAVVSMGYEVGWPSAGIASILDVTLHRSAVTFEVNTQEDGWPFTDPGEAVDKFLALVAERRAL